MIFVKYSPAAGMDLNALPLATTGGDCVGSGEELREGQEKLRWQDDIFCKNEKFLQVGNSEGYSKKAPSTYIKTYKTACDCSARGNSSHFQ